MKNFDIAFLHTARMHEDTFNKLTTQLDPDLRTYHYTDAHLLIDAQARGIDKRLVDRIEACVSRLAERADVVVCTCSTIGEIAERCSSQQTPVIRIDRAMARFAASYDKVLVLATAESTLHPTVALLQNEAGDDGRNRQIDIQVVPNAWDAFERGDIEEYYQSIQTMIASHQIDYDVIVLAQVSMAGALEGFKTMCFVLTSPKLGVIDAIRALPGLTMFDSVGLGGVNQHDDVKAVQKALNVLSGIEPSYLPVNVTGEIYPRPEDPTIKAISLFQRSMGAEIIDGLIEVNGPTHQHAAQRLVYIGTQTLVE